MIDRQHGRIVLECDSCDTAVESETGEDFEVFWQRAKRDGWTARTIADEWLHGCPDCGAPR